MGTPRIGASPGTSGTEVRRREPAAALSDSPLGTTFFAGAYPWGPTDEVVEHSGESHYSTIRQGLIREDPTPLCVQHFYQLARGAGKALTLRLVDGDEARAFRHLSARDCSSTRTLKGAYMRPQGVAKVEGLYYGRRGGAQNRLLGVSADLGVAADFAAGTFATGVTMLLDEWKHATLSIQGMSSSYIVTSNSIAGVLSIDVASGETEPSGAGNWTLLLDTPNTLDEEEGIGFAVGTSHQNPTTETTLEAYDFVAKKFVAPSYESLGTDSTLDSYNVDVVNDEGDLELQNWLKLTNRFAGNSALASNRPANWVGLPEPTSAGANVITLQTTFSQRVVATGDAYLDPTSVAYGTSPAKMRAQIYFTAPTTFTVTFEEWWGDKVLSSGTFAGTLGTLFNPQSQAFPSFKLFAGTTPMAADDNLIIWFAPLPADLNKLGGRLYPHADDRSTGYNLRTSFPIRSNTSTTVTLDSSVDLATDHSFDVDGRATGTSTIAGTYNLAGGETFIYQNNAEAAVTLTQTLVGAAITATALAAELNTQEAAAHADLPRMQFGVSSDDKITMTALYDQGTGGSFTATTGTLNAIIGVVNSTTYTGTVATAVALEYAEALEFGRDGVASLATADYQAAWDLVSSPLNDLARQDLGLVKCCMPGVSNATAQNAAIDYVADAGYAFRGEIGTASATNETTAAAWVRDNIDGDENRSFAWDSYGYVRSKPFPGTDAAYPMTGAILGAEAALAAERGGYHVAAAGVKMNIGELFATLESVGLTAQDPAPKDEKILNPAGVQPMQQEGRLIYPDGDRNSADLNKGTVWKHKVECILHIMHTLRVAGRDFEWEPNDPTTRSTLVTALYPLLKGYFDDGWFDREAGQEFFDVVTIACGDAENPAAVKAAGEMHAVIEIPQGIVDTAERVIFTLGSEGVAAG